MLDYKVFMLILYSFNFSLLCHLQNQTSPLIKFKAVTLPSSRCEGFDQLLPST